MKRILISALSLALFAACGSNESATNSTPTDADTLVSNEAPDVTGASTDILDESEPDTLSDSDINMKPDAASDAEEPEAPECEEEGALCDDMNPCTHTDQCSAGLCTGTSYACDDGRSCTDNECDGYGGCRYPISEDACLINNICYEAGASGLFSPCLICAPETSNTSFAVAEDDTTCGGSDPCLGEGVCVDIQCSAKANGCDDNNPCTDDLCDPVNGCQYQNNFDLCDDGHACSQGDQCFEGSCKPGPVVLYCDDGNICTTDSCTEDGCAYENIELPCDDGNKCTENDQCANGSCGSGPALSCTDGNNCTIDSCSEASGCTHTLINNPCCVGAAHICDDGNTCTVDLCDEDTGICSWTNLEGPCDDENACTFSDSCTEDYECEGAALECNDNNTCTADSCEPAVGCVHTPLQGPCSDGDNCTVDDSCVGTGTCLGTLVSCNDYDPCTLDGCTAEGGCSYSPADSVPCTDGDLCTQDDSCLAGECTGTPKDCSDGNDCTADICHPASGCQHLNVVGSCDDGNPCTTASTCEEGACVGTSTDCGACMTFNAPANKIVEFALGTNGQPGQALNIDGKTATCSPITDCSEGLDNGLAPISAIANSPIVEALENGDIMLVLEHRNFKTDGTPYSLVLWDTRVADNDCDYLNESCNFLVHKGSISPTCEPQFQFNNAVINEGKLSAGGGEESIFVLIPLSSETFLPLIVEKATIEATVTVENGAPIIVEGLIGGAIAKASLVSAVNSIPLDDFPPEVSKAAIMTLLNLVVKNDIDSNGDGNKDAASIGLPFKAIPATILGVKD